MSNDKRGSFFLGKLRKSVENLKKWAQESKRRQILPDSCA